jgi:CRP-like cAMP-binding protein
MGHNNDRPKTRLDINLITNSLKEHFIFTNLPEENINSIINAMKLFKFEAKDFIF